MAEVTKKTEVDVNGVPAVEAEQTKEVPAPRPNRDKYASMFAEDNPGMDFEDKESRYGRMAEERESYRKLRDSGKKLSENFNKRPWAAAMIQDIFDDETGELDPVSWMYRHGIDVQKAMEDDEYRQKCVEGLNAWLDKAANSEKSEEEMDNNALQAQQNLSDLAEELNLSDEQCNRMWNYLFNDVIAPGQKFEVSKETWQTILHALNYDQDIKNAREEAGIQARNEKHANKVKTFEEKQVPPTFSQGQKQPVVPKQQKRESNMDFIRKYT